MRLSCGRRALVLAVIASAVLAAPVSGGVRGLQFRLYDPTGGARTVVTAADLVRSSARATREPDESGKLYFRLTSHGVAKLRVLTRELAQRGARLRQPQRFEIAVAGIVYVRAPVDYRIYPEGLDARSGINIRMRLSAARALAKAIRSD